jgi:aspartate kinase
VAKAEAALRPVMPDLGEGVTLEATDGIAKLSVVGIGMRSHSGVAAKLFDLLSKGGFNIQMISTSEIKIAVILDEDRIADAAKAAHAGFGLSA